MIKPIRLLISKHFIFPLQFRCSDDNCIAGLYVCDGIPDCRNGEDENQCVGTICKAGQFYCYSNGGACLSANMLCDGKVDCSNFQVLTLKVVASSCTLNLFHLTV